MPILKHIKVDNIEDVTILVLKDIALRNKITEDGRIQILICEANKTNKDVMVQLNETESLCWNDETSHIDIIIDIPKLNGIDFLINYLTELRKDVMLTMRTS